MGIKCTESSTSVLQIIENGTFDDEANRKLNEVIQRVNQIDGKVSTIKNNETNFMSLIVNIQRDILDLKKEKFTQKITNGNYTNTSEVKMLIDQMNNITLEKQQISIEQLLHKINELSLKIEQTKLDNEKKLLTVQQSSPPLPSSSQSENFATFNSYKSEKSSETQKHVGVSSVEFLLGILLTMTLTLLIVLAVYQAKNFMKRNALRMPRISGRNTPNTIITYDSQSVA